MIIRIYSDMEISYSVHSSQTMYYKGEPRMYCKGEPSTSGSICDETMIFSEHTTYLSSSMIRLSSYVSKVENWSVHTTWTCANIKCSHTYLYCRVSLFILLSFFLKLPPLIVCLLTSLESHLATGSKGHWRCSFPWTVVQASATVRGISWGRSGKDRGNQVRIGEIRQGKGRSDKDRRDQVR